MITEGFWWYMPVIFRDHETAGGRGRGLGEGEDLVAVAGDQEGVLELGGALAVPGNRRPVIGPDVVGDGAEGEHRLDGERHALLHDDADLGVVEMRDDEAGMERCADAVPGEVADHPASEPAGVGLDPPSDRGQRPPWGYRANAAHHGLVGALYQQPRFLVDVTRQERGVCIP